MNSCDKIHNEYQMKLIDLPAERIAFSEEIDAVCKKYGLSISHQDRVADFMIERYSEENRQWLFKALMNYE